MRPSSASILGRVAEDGKVGHKGGLTWHDLRHEFVSFLVDQGGEIHEVREAARHKDIRTTERYMKAREVRLKALMSKLSTTSRYLAVTPTELQRSMQMAEERQRERMHQRRSQRKATRRRA